MAIDIWISDWDPETDTAVRCLGTVLPPPEQAPASGSETYLDAYYQQNLNRLWRLWRQTSPDSDTDEEFIEFLELRGWLRRDGNRVVVIDPEEALHGE